MRDIDEFMTRQQTQIKRYQNVFLLIVFSPHTHKVFLPKTKVKETKSVYYCGNHSPTCAMMFEVKRKGEG